MLKDSERDRGQGSPTAEDLAAEFLARKAAGELVAAAEFLARLPDVEARDAFQGLVAGAGAAERGLPRAIAAGSLIAGRYRIQEAIGAGGMGRVFSAFDEKLGRVVALKVLAPLSEGNREREEMFAKESRLLADLKHPGIVAVHDAGNDGEFTYIVMDLVEGTAIADVIERARRELERGAHGNRLPPRDGALLSRAIGREVGPGSRELVDPRDWYRSVARILLEIARTLEAAHGRQVIHRDLKPANVMLLGGGAPVVLDFGLAASPNLSKGGVTEGLYGSVAYLAPEQAKSQRVGKDVRTDVYQLGLILYELLTLRRAFPGTAIGAVLEKIEHGNYPLPRKFDPAVPPDLEAICTMALEVSPDRRYPSAQALREDLERWLEGRAPLASRSARWRTFVRTARYTGKRHPVIVAAVGMLLVGSIVYVSIPASTPSALGVFKKYAEHAPAGSPKIVPLPDRGGVVEVGDSLLITVKSTGPRHVYALSVFGTEEQKRFVFPYRPWLAVPPKDAKGRDVEPEKQAGTAWGLLVGGGDCDVVCTIIENADNLYEGLLVLTSPIARPELDDWMQTLKEKSGNEGVPFERALELLEKGPPATRGAHSASWTTDERKRIEVEIRKAREEGRVPHLPGVDTSSLECLVAKK